MIICENLPCGVGVGGGGGGVWELSIFDYLKFCDMILLQSSHLTLTDP